MNEVSLESQKKMSDLILDTPKVIKIRGYKYTIRAMRKHTNLLLSHLLVSQRLSQATVEDNIGSMQRNEEFQAKALSVALLNNWLKIYLFHWIYWRILLRRHTEAESVELLKEVVEKMSIDFFFLNTKIVESLNLHIRKLTAIEQSQAGRKQG